MAAPPYPCGLAPGRAEPRGCTYYQGAALQALARYGDGGRQFGKTATARQGRDAVARETATARQGRDSVGIVLKVSSARTATARHACRPPSPYAGAASYACPPRGKVENVAPQAPQEYPCFFLHTVKW
eukprot:gene21874-biopygen14722